MPAFARAGFDAQFLRIPKTQEEARKQVDELAAKGVNAIKGILEAGVPGHTFNRMNLDLLRAVVEEAHVEEAAGLDPHRRQPRRDRRSRARRGLDRTRFVS